jgi:hypothetical protein
MGTPTQRAQRSLYNTPNAARFTAHTRILDPAADERQRRASNFALVSVPGENGGMYPPLFRRTHRLGRPSRVTARAEVFGPRRNNAPGGGLRARRVVLSRQCTSVLPRADSYRCGAPPLTDSGRNNAAHIVLKARSALISCPPALSAPLAPPPSARSRGAFFTGLARYLRKRNH